MVKILKKNFLIAYDQSSSASTGNTTVSYIYDLDRSTKWQSIGSDDSTAETIEIDFSDTQTIDRLCLCETNLKDFSIQYNAGAGYVDFTNVISSKTDTATTGISYTTNSDETKYFEFDSVAVDNIKITMNKTMVVDAQKYITEFYVGLEVGTFTDDLTSSPNKFQPITRYTRSKYIEKSNGGIIKLERAEKYRAKIKIKEMFETADQTIIDTMFTDGEFSISPCGFDNNYPNNRGWRLRDFYNVIIKGDDQAAFSIGRDLNMGFAYKFELQES